jgi:hypothetical protein
MIATEADFKHFNENYKFPVMTSQEVNLIFNFINSMQIIDSQIVTKYSTTPDLNFGFIQAKNTLKGQQVLTF